MTVIEFVIHWWTTGRCIPVLFHVDSGVAYHMSSEKYLDDVLKKAGPLRRHRMMVNILDLVRSTTPADEDATVDAGLVDYENMPE
ncbi:hypothetical protein EUX98_g6871 [Antrodiella citrinella]|uniref:Uncharacterized protein n=1 Tax=Antrodiella citrinella TaxID=2447956 RepID=A0A4S4MPQ6_9APHY|nr:hypothetical protein EUX98_g6871 [Antrodiella citrinella]